MKTRNALLMWLGLIFLLAGCSGVENQPMAPVADVTMQAGGPSGLSEVRVVPPGTTPHGSTYPEWSAKWWRWLWSAPVDQNPGLDDTGEDVGWDQEGKVWYLAPAYYGVWERTATVPAGRMLFINLAGTFTALATGDGANEQELRDVAAWVTDNVSNIVLRVDGWELDNVEDYRFTSPSGYFDYSLPEDNMFQFFGLPVEAGEYEDGVADGYYVMLEPLPVGEHTIFMSAEFGEPYFDTVQVTYHLSVKGGHRHHDFEEDSDHGHH